MFCRFLESPVFLYLLGKVSCVSHPRPPFIHMQSLNWFGGKLWHIKCSPRASVFPKPDPYTEKWVVTGISINWWFLPRARKQDFLAWILSLVFHPGLPQTRLWAEITVQRRTRQTYCPHPLLPFFQPLEPGSQPGRGCCHSEGGVALWWGRVL